MTTNEKIGEMMSELRMDRNIRQMDAAHDLNITKQALGHYEKGRRAIHFPLLVKMARYYGASLEHFAEAVAGKVPVWAVERKEPCEYCKPKYYEFYKVIHMEKYCPNCGRRLEKEEDQ